MHSKLKCFCIEPISSTKPRGLRNQCRLSHHNIRLWMHKPLPKYKNPKTDDMSIILFYVIFKGAHWMTDPLVFFSLASYSHWFMHEFIPFACGCSIDELISCAHFQCLQHRHHRLNHVWKFERIKNDLTSDRRHTGLNRMMQPQMNFTFSPAFLHRAKMSLLCETQSLNQRFYNENKNDWLL